MGGRFGEMYAFQSFNFRGRKGARPFYDLIANIAAGEFGRSSARRFQLSLAPQCSHSPLGVVNDHRLTDSHIEGRACAGLRVLARDVSLRRSSFPCCLRSS
jgi:hypothetical protein